MSHRSLHSSVSAFIVALFTALSFPAQADIPLRGSMQDARAQTVKPARVPATTMEPVMATQGVDDSDGSSSSSSSSLSGDTVVAIVIAAGIVSGLAIFGCCHCCGWPGCPCMRATMQGRLFGCEPCCPR